MPAAAVTPAQVVDIKVAAVKKLVVGFVTSHESRHCLGHDCDVILGWKQRGIRLSCCGCPSFTVKKSARSKQAYAVECISME